jgi:hypothetical protein
MAAFLVMGFNFYHYYGRDLSDSFPGARGYHIFYPYSSVFNPKIDEHHERFIENYRDVAIEF